MSELVFLALVAGAASSDATTSARRQVDELRGRASRPEAIAQISSLLRQGDSLPPAWLAELLEPLAERGTDPLVAAQAAYHLAIDEERRGQGENAERRWQKLGLLRDFWVLGPFDAQGKSGLARRYAPEEGAPDPRRNDRHAGKEREVAWRRAPAAAVRQGALFLDAMLRPDSDAVAYVIAVVRSDRGAAADLRIGSSGPVRAWLNGAAVLERNAMRPAALDQDVARVRLRRGENWILIKTVVGTGAWRLLARLTDPRGLPLAGLASTSPRSAAPEIARLAERGHTAAAGRRHQARDLGLILRRRAERAHGPDRHAAWLDLGRCLALLTPDDSESKAVEDALERAAGGGGETTEVSVQALLLLGELARDDDDRRVALEKVERLAGFSRERSQALVGLGTLAKLKRRDAAAATFFRRALALDTGYVPAILALASEEQAAGLPSAALARIEALPEVTRSAPNVARARLRILEALGRRAEMDIALRALHENRRTDLDLTQNLATVERSRSNLPAAAALMAEAARQRPDLPFLVIELARIQEARGDLEAARAALREAAERLPDEARLHEELGRLLVRADRPAEALPALQRALVLRPQNPALRRYAQSVAASAGNGVGREAAADELAAEFAEDGEALARAALRGEGRASADDTGRSDAAVVLLEKRVVRVHDNGLSETFAQRLLEVRSDRGARENHEFWVRYTPGAQEVEIRKARVFRRAAAHGDKDGAGGADIDVSEATARDDRDLSEPWYGLYYDTRAEVVGYEDLRAGDVVEVQYTVADVGNRNEMADYFGDFQIIGDSVAKRRWDYTLIGPAGRSFFFNDPKLDPKAARLRKTVAPRGAETVYRFEARDVPKVEPEPSMPGFAEVAPYLHVSTYRAWQDVGRWYWHLVEDQLTADDDVRRIARTSTAGLATDVEKVRALHRFVIEGTRYVGLEFGIHGYKPYRVAEVLTRRFGDCKDKASLLLALLREVGIDSELVLVRTRRGGRVDSRPASLAVFDHAIVYVPRLDLYLDGTAEFAGMPELPSQDQGVMVLRVGPEGATLTETPVLPSSANLARRRWAVDLDTDGGAQIEEELTLTGQAAPEWRAHYQTPGERRERLSKTWNGRFPGARVETFALDGVEDRNRPLTLQARVRVPRLGDVRDGGRRELPVAAREPDFVRSYARLSRRTLDLLIAYPWQHHEEIVYHLPEGWRIERLPTARHEDNGFGRFDLEATASADGRRLLVRSWLDVERHRVAPGEYGAFRRFLGAIDAALNERVVLVREGE